HVDVEGPSPLHDLFLHAKNDGERDIGLGAVYVPAANVFAMAIVKEVEAEDAGYASGFVDDVVEIPELGVSHLRPGIVGRCDAVPAGIGPHSHDTEVAVSICEDRGLGIEGNK